jgi:hypothetical protein
MKGAEDGIRMTRSQDVARGIRTPGEDFVPRRDGAVFPDFLDHTREELIGGPRVCAK